MNLVDLTNILAGKLAKTAVKKAAVLEFLDETDDPRNRKLGGKIGAGGRYLAEQVQNIWRAWTVAPSALIERLRLEAVLEQIKFQSGDLVKPGGLDELGKVERVDAIVIGSVRRWA